MSDNKYTIVIITSDQCGYCNRYKQSGYHENMIKELSKLPYTNVVAINLPEMNAVSVLSGTSKYHKNLWRYAQWFPIIIVFNETFDDKDSDLKGVIYGAIRDKQGGVTHSPGINISDPKVFKQWLQEELKQNPIFSSERKRNRNIKPDSIIVANKNSVVNTSNPEYKYIKYYPNMYHDRKGIPKTKEW